MVSLALLAAAGRARGQASPAAAPAPVRTAQLAYVRGAGATRCPDDAAMRDAVIARLGYDPFAPSETTVQASITRRGRGLRGRIEVRAGTRRRGVRQIDARGSDCVELARSMALAISVAIDPLALTRPAPEAAATEGQADAPGSGTRANETTANAAASDGSTAATSPTRPDANPPPAALARASSAPASVTPPAPAAPQRPPPRSPAASDAPPRRAPAPSARARIGLGIDGLYGLQPGVAPGAHLHLGVRWPRFSLGLELRGALPTTVTDAPGVVSITAATATALGCLHDTPVRYLALCAVASGSLLVGAGAMFPVPAAPALLGPVVAVGGRAGAEVPLGRVLSLAAHAELAWVPTVAAFRVDNPPSGTSAQPWSTPGFAAGAAIEALVHFR